MSRKSDLHTLAAVAIAVAACGESGTGPPPPPPPPPATQLVFLTQPDTASEAQFTLAIRVAVQDASGNLVTETARDVTIRLAANPSGATLSGTTTVRATAGIATFSDLGLERAGDGFIFQVLSPGLPPVTSIPFSIRLTFASAATGWAHSCGVTVAGFAYCWGANGDAQLGDSTFVNRLVVTPVRGRLQFAQLSGGIDHTCGITLAGAAYCWGNGSQGKIGDGSTFGSPVRVRVLGGVSFTQISAGSAHSCGVTTTHAAYCWGTNSFFELGTGSGTPGTMAPVPVAGSHQFIHISAGDHHTCAITVDHEAYCWGDNVYGQLGDSTQQPRDVPTPVAGAVSFAEIATALSYTCGISVDHKLYCWGLGPANSGAFSLLPAEVPGGHVYVSVSTGYRHACAVSTDSLAYCWGENANGGVGDSSNAPVATPKLVVGGLHFLQVSVGNGHTCGVTTDHAAYCWGRNLFGSLGDGTPTDRYAPVRAIQ